MLIARLKALALASTLALSFAVLGDIYPAFADCNMSGCTQTNVRTKAGTAITCTPLSAVDGCGCASAYGGTCESLTMCHSLGGASNGPCRTSGQICCSLRKDSPDQAPAQQLTEQDEQTYDDITSAMDGNVQPMTSSFWGYYNSTLKSPSTGVGSNCEAKIHVCFVHGFSDLSGVTDQNSCNNACNSATNTNQNECYDTDCSSRCGGWWGGTDTCG